MSIQSQTLGRWTASIDLYVNNLDYVPQLGESCLVLDNNNRIFAGCITQVVADRFLGTKHSMVFRCTAVDKSGICDHRIVAGATYSKLDEFGQPRDIADTIIRITTSYLNGEGFTLGPEIVRGAFGPQSVDYNWNFPTVTAAFDQICSNEGLVWWVDSYSVLHFSSLTNLPDAPFGLTENSNNWRNLTITRSTTAFSNKLYAVSNISVIPGSAVGSGSTGQQGLVETITWSTTSPNVVIQNGVAVGFKVSVALGTVISLTVNGNTQTVYDFANYSGQTRINSNDYLWEFHAGNNQLSWTYGFSPTGQNIVINYTPFSTQSSSSAQYGTALSPAYGGPLGRCGSGIYEGVVQVDSINDATQLNSIASAMLTRIGGVPTVADFETDYAGLLTGQLIPIDVPWSTCGDGTTAVKLMITAVSGVHMPAGQAPNGSLGTGSNFRWTIQANSNLDPGNYIKWYERLVGRTNNPLPIKKLVPARFILGNGGNLSAGNALGNPYIVNETAQLVELLMAAATPPTGQNLTIEITRAGIVIAAITMLYTQAANTLIYIPLSSDKSPWLFKGDILQFNASYQPLTTNPTPASNVSLTLNTTA
jgi:hypothetical protein